MGSSGGARNGRLTRAARTGVVSLVVVASLGLVWSPASASSPVLRRYPYLSEVVGNSATVNWATDRSLSTGSATWGVVSGADCTPTNTVNATKVSITVGSTSEYQWTAVINFPSAGTYCYRAQLGAVDLLDTDPSPRVTTAARPGSSFSFAVMGDWGAGTTDQANVMSRIGASPASFAVTVGDNVYTSGTETEYGDLTQGNVFPSQYLPAIGSRPMFAAEGNHGFSTYLPYLQNFPAPTAAATSGGRFAPETYCCISTLSGSKKYPSAWYAFNWGSARFYVLEGAWADSQGAYQGDFLAHWNGPVAGCGPCGAELEWLQNDLATHQGTLKFAFLHYPLYSDSSNQPSDTYLSGAANLEGLLANNGVGIAFSGHAHHYERNYPQIAGQPLVTYITGGGGAAAGSVSSCSAFDAYAIGSGGSSCRAPRPGSNANVFHFLLVTVNGNQVTVTPTDSTGRTFDVQTYTFSGGGGGDVVAPSAPGGLSAVASGATRVDLGWTASTDDVGVTSYAITRNGSALATVSGSATSFSDTTASPNTAYSYSVRAGDAAGNTSPASNTATVTTPSGGGSTFTFTASDDSYLDQVSSSTNFGSDSRLVADHSPVQDAIMKFNVATGGCGVTKATLALTVGTSGSDGSNKGGDLHTTVGSGWSEGTVTWANAPAANAATIASLGAVTAGTTYVLDITSAVAGDGPLSLRLINTSSDGARYFSKEGSTTQQPKLTITCASDGGDVVAPSAPGGLSAVASGATRVDLGWTASTDDVGVTSYAITRNGSALATVSGSATSFSDTTASPNTAYSYSVRAGDTAGNTSPASNTATVTTPSGGGSTFTFTASDDSYLDQVSSSTNFGSDSRLVADHSPVQDAIMKFNVATGGCGVTKATLALTVGTSGSDGSNKGGDLHTTVGSGWSEGTVTWANAPAANAATIASLGAVTAGTTYVLDITSAVAGDGPLSLRLINTSSDGARYFSKEGSTTQQPKLTITCRVTTTPKRGVTTWMRPCSYRSSIVGASCTASTCSVCCCHHTRRARGQRLRRRRRGGCGTCSSDNQSSKDGADGPPAEAEGDRPPRDACVPPGVLGRAEIPRRQGIEVEFSAR